MSSKDKESKGLPEKLKQFFRLNKNAGVPKRNDFVINQEIEKEISPDSPLNHRLKVIRELSDSVLANHLEDKMIEKLWFCVQDLLSEHHARETRHVTFGFIQCLVRGQPDRLGMLRAHFFRLIKKNSPAEDVVPRFELLQSLTENGKYILHFEDEIGPFLQQWMPEVTAAGKTQDFLYLLVNVVKFNAAYIDEDVIAEFVKNTSLLCCSASQQAVVMACLQVLDAVVCYSILPNDSLPTFIAALCRTVSHEAYCRSSWKIMRNLLGTHLGHAALHTMCRALQEPALSSDPGLLRGAVFHINRGLWGCDRVTQLRCSPSAVLPSFLQVLKNCNHPVVMYEVMLSIQMLVKKQGQELAKKQGQELVKKQIYELQDPCWDNILDIIEEIIKHIENSSQSNSSLVASHLHETLTTIEELMESKHFSGSEQKVFGLIERCASSRPETSVLHLIDYLSKSVVPTRHKWLSKLHLIFEHYFKQETRTKIRITVLEILSNVINVNRAMYEEELVENIVILHLENIASDPDVLVRNTAASLLVNLCLECDTKRCLELLDILDKLLKRPFDIYGETTSPAIEADLLDVNTVVTGLIRVFISKLHVLPSSHAVHVYQMLVSHLEAHYAKPHIFDNSNHIRYKIFECFLKIRANSLYHIGYPDSTTGVLRFSPYLCVAPGSGTSAGSPPPSSPAIVPPTQPCVVTPVSLKRGFSAVVTCIKQEKDWEVLHLILQEVPKVMQNKSLILSRQGNTDIDLLATALCNIVTEKSLGLPETLYNTPMKFARSEFHSHVLPVLASLASYHGYLDSVRQKLLVRCLVKNGLVSRCSRQCITALTTCTLEMRDVMVKLLPEVLLDISKVSATVHISIPILEFLSTLTRLPNVFASFVGDQYMSVFAISLPYTNPFKYNHYTVSLAHHVIAVWFLKCRLPFRKDFVTFITKGLRANVIVPFEEGQINKSSELLNEDSSNRKRSSSLTEQGSRSRRERPPIPPTGRLDTRAALDLRPTIDDALSTFHTELTETCIDLMARYTFSPCSAVPKRLPTAEFLLAGGQSMSWLIGNKLVTITTSGCSQKALKNGLCDKCWAFCKPDSLIISDPDSDFKRYSRSTLNRSGSGEESNRVTRQNSSEVQKSSQDSPVEEKKDITTNLISTEKLELLPSKLHQLLGSDKLEMKPERSLCACWCQGWAEVYVRRPTGDMSWVMRIQNQIGSQSSLVDLPLNEMSTLFLPSLDRRADSERDIKTDESDAETSEHNKSTYSWKTSSVSGPINIPGSPLKQSPFRQNSHESFEEEIDADIYENGSKSRNPVRRSNSSPEMSASWKNPFLLQEKIDKMNSGYEYSADDQVGNVPEVSQKKCKNYGKDMRVSCEAIPEEMSGLGTTPPSVDVTEQSQHPQLLSCHSCPAAERENTNVESVKGPVTVPSSPVTLANATQNSPYAYSQTDLFKTAVQNQAKKESDATTKGAEGQKERPSNLSVVNKTGGSPLTTKPPQSPTQTSPRFSRHGSDKESGVKTSTTLMRSVSSTIEKQTKFAQSTEKINVESRTDLLPIRRDRGYTMPVISPIRKPRIRKTNSPHGKEAPKSGISPSFVFLQLYHSSYFGTSDKSNEKPLLIGQSTEMQRSLKLLDHIPPYETHKVGVIYVGPGQCNDEAAILRNHFGSLRYVQFLQKLGTLIKLQDADRQTFFLGGLDQSGKDGKFTYIWQDDVIQVTFHVATLMPYEESDHQCNQKKCHIGNDFVTIVYNESGQEYNMQTIKAQFNFACVVIEPLDHGTNRVTVKARDELAEHIGHTEPKIISDQNVALLARQLALHANNETAVWRRFMTSLALASILGYISEHTHRAGTDGPIYTNELASMIARSLKTQGHSPYASNWLERLRCIKRIRSKVIQEISATKEKSGNGNGADNDPLSARPSRRVHMDDFTEYT